MSRLLVELYIALALLGGEEMSGYAPRYAPGVMERVSRNRDLPNYLNEDDDIKK